MSNYTKTTDFAAKDALPHGNAAKKLSGTELGTEFDAIAIAVATKADSSSVGLANPTGVVGLATVNGVASTFMRSDAAPPLSQAIVPTWTGTHTFAGAGLTHTFAGKVAIGTPSAGVALAIAGVALGTAQTWTDGTRTAQVNFAASNMEFGTTTAHGIDLFTNGATRLNITSGGNVFINTPPISGDTLTVGGGGDGLVLTGGLMRLNGSTSQINAYAATAFELVQRNNAPMNFYTNAAQRMVIAAGGAIAINAPTTGTALGLTGAANFNAITVSGSATSGQSFGLYINSGTTSADYAIRAQSQAGVDYFKVRGDGLVQAADDAGALQTVGWRDLPPNQQGANYTTVMADRGKMINGIGAITITIAANASVAYPQGTTLVVANSGSNTITIAINTDVLTLAGTGSTGPRSLAINGLATIVKNGPNNWLITGPGVS